MAKLREYSYNPPSYEATVDRAEKKGSLFDAMFKDVKTYRPKQGANLLRILPAPKGHYGLQIMVHRDVGPNDRQYLCLKENQSSPHNRCPVCEELYNLGARASQEEKNLLRPKSSILYYVVDRDNEKDGVLVWVTSSRTDSDLAALSVNRRSKSVIDIVHPEDGYDFEFLRTGTTRNNTRYNGFQIMREPSPLSDSDKRMDEWLDVAFDRPLSSILQYYSPEHIEQVFYGKAKEEEDEKSSTRSRRDEPVEEEERPLRRTRRTEPDDDDTERKGTRSRRAGRDDDDETNNDASNETRASARTAEGVDPPPRRRSRTAEVIDDDIPIEGGRRARSNGRDAIDEASNEKEEPPARTAAQAARRQAARPVDDEEEEKPVRRTRRASTDDEDEPVDAAADESRRERMRARLNRE